MPANYSVSFFFCVNEKRIKPSFNCLEAVAQLLEVSMTAIRLHFYGSRLKLQKIFFKRNLNQQFRRALTLASVGMTPRRMLVRTILFQDIKLLFTILCFQTLLLYYVVIQGFLQIRR